MTDLEIMKTAAEIAHHTRCWIGIGCVIAKNGKILVEAWNETMPGEEYCQEFRKRRVSKGSTLAYAKVEPYHNNKGCIRYDLMLSGGRDAEKVCSVHAEVNAIAKAARQGMAVNGAIMYITSFPCLICMRSIIAAGIKKVVYMNDFYKPHHLEMFAKAGIKVQQIPENEIWKKE